MTGAERQRRRRERLRREREEAAKKAGKPPKPLPNSESVGAVNDHPFAGRKPPFRSILAWPYVAEGANMKESAGFAARWN
jgi:hypothetical protein